MNATSMSSSACERLGGLGDRRDGGDGLDAAGPVQELAEVTPRGAFVLDDQRAQAGHVAARSTVARVPVGAESMVSVEPGASQASRRRDQREAARVVARPGATCRGRHPRPCSAACDR